MNWITDQSDIEVGRPINRETIRTTERGYLATCYETRCDWEGLFPDPDLAKAACERHWDHEQRSGEWHYGSRNYQVIELLDGATACTLDQSELGLSVEEIRLGTRDGGVREVEFPRTTGDVAELVERGDRILLPPERPQKVVAVVETRSHGLPTWSVGFCDVGDDLLSDNLPPRGSNELIARDGKIYCSFGPDPLSTPAFEVVGETEHQADLAAFGGGTA